MTHLKAIIVSAILIVVSAFQPLLAQILNIEEERIKTDSTGWSGKLKFSLAYQKTDVDFFRSDAYAHTQFKTNKDLFLLLADHSLSKGNGKEFINTSTQHFRYNRKLMQFLTAEAFVQGQFNKILDVRYRILAGAGPRWTIVKTDIFRLYAGNLYMFEWEILTTGAETQTHRLSNYLSFSLNLSNTTRLVHTTYYQPALADPGDFRILSQSSLRLKINKHLSFSFDYKFYHDSHPPVGIIGSTHSFLNGIEIVF